MSHDLLKFSKLRQINKNFLYFPWKFRFENIQLYKEMNAKKFVQFLGTLSRVQNWSNCIVCKNELDIVKHALEIKMVLIFTLKYRKNR